MSTMLSKITLYKYQTVKDFADDVTLMCNNCFTYITPETQYYKCAENIRNYFTGILEKYKTTIVNWGYEL